MWCINQRATRVAGANIKSNTYEGSKGVDGWEPLKLWAKLRLPPNCLEEVCSAAPPPPPPIGTLPPPNAHPPLFAIPATKAASASDIGSSFRPGPGLGLGLGLIADRYFIPSFPFGNRLDTDLFGCCGCCCWPPNPAGIPRRFCGTAPNERNPALAKFTMDEFLYDDGDDDDDRRDRCDS